MTGPLGGRGPLTALGGLIGAVSAVFVMVTHEVFGDTLSALAHELVPAACVVED